MLNVRIQNDNKGYNYISNNSPVSTSAWIENSDIVNSPSMFRSVDDTHASTNKLIIFSAGNTSLNFIISPLTEQGFCLYNGCMLLSCE